MVSLFIEVGFGDGGEGASKLLGIVISEGVVKNSRLTGFLVIERRGIGADEKVVGVLATQSNTARTAVDGG